MIAGVSSPGPDQRATWAYWIACGLAATAALVPVALAHGANSRVVWTAIPFGLSAILTAANALFHHRGRPFSTALYFVAGLTIVYAIFAMAALPVRLAIVGTCPAPPLLCPPGVEPGIHDYEMNSIATSVLLGALAIGVGFLGLHSIYRHRATT